jgi:hypothetical protein
MGIRGDDSLVGQQGSIGALGFDGLRTCLGHDELSRVRGLEVSEQKMEVGLGLSIGYDIKVSNSKLLRVSFFMELRIRNSMEMSFSQF